MSAKQKIEFQIKGIEILNSEINIPKEKLPSNVVFRFDMLLEQRFDLEQDLIFVVCDITTFPSDNSESKLGKIRSNCIFSVPELKKYVTDDKKITLSDEFSLTINSVAISTTRGLMFSLFKGTFLHGAILPLIDPTQNKKISKDNL